jgi:hypothetical protein
VRRRGIVVVQRREQMLLLHSSHDELSAGAPHVGKELFTSLIDERDFFEINDCAGQRR